MAWYLNPALTRFRNTVNARWPNRDKRSDGTIGDADHAASTSDHNPDPDGTVDAWDMDIDGVDVWACINAAIRHESIQYIIFNRRVTSRNKPGGLGVWHPYTGSNPHDKHVHFNTRPSHERSNAPWHLSPGAPESAPAPQGDDDVSEPIVIKAAQIIEGWANGSATGSGGHNVEPVKWRVRDEAWQAHVNAKLDALAARTTAAPVSVDASAVAQALAANPAFLSAIAKAVVDESHKRLKD